jgi:predicted nucleic acid-binding Zn ribbon protein
MKCSYCKRRKVPPGRRRFCSDECAGLYHNERRVYPYRGQRAPDLQRLVEELVALEQDHFDWVLMEAARRRT